MSRTAFCVLRWSSADNDKQDKDKETDPKAPATVPIFVLRPPPSCAHLTFVSLYTLQKKWNFQFSTHYDKHQIKLHLISERELLNCVSEIEKDDDF